MMTVEEKPDVTYNDVGGCKEQIEKMRVDALSEAKEQGYQSGYEEGMAQVQALKDEYIQEKENLEKEYESILEELVYC